MKSHLIFEDRSTQIGLEFEAFHDRDVHLVLELLVAVLALALGEIHREVCVAQQLITAVIANAEGDADAYGRRQFLRSDRDRLAQRPHNPLSESNDLSATGNVLDQNGEFVTAESSR